MLLQLPHTAHMSGLLGGCCWATPCGVQAGQDSSAVLLQLLHAAHMSGLLGGCCWTTPGGVQAGQDSSAVLLQLPHMTAEVLRKMVRKRMRTLADLLLLSPPELEELLTSSGTGLSHVLLACLLVARDSSHLQPDPCTSIAGLMLSTVMAVAAALSPGHVCCQGSVRKRALCHYCACTCSCLAAAMPGAGPISLAQRRSSMDV